MAYTQFEKFNYLVTNVYKDIVHEIDEFSPTIVYFNEGDFEKVLLRVEQLGIGIYGIETLLNGEYYSVEVFEDYKTMPEDSKWYTAAFNKFKNWNLDLRYSASYSLESLK
ncbi:hypothetical protein [Pedobacter helvus]|uniref:Uncharacterized protein n=1 Tax=Pedobacter helvus TaxID=2563444 RepID=A0ABW9JCA2_9SPHI|nr:hypothetical protein [Pedobacter ureilyticus]